MEFAMGRGEGLRAPPAPGELPLGSAAGGTPLLPTAFASQGWVPQLWDPGSNSLSPHGCPGAALPCLAPWVCPGVPRDLVSPPRCRLCTTGSSSILASRCPSTSGC